MTPLQNKIETLTNTWLNHLQSQVLDENASWIGVYWLESFIDPTQSQSTDLLVGSFLGFETPHVRISLQKGVCGRAIRENQTLNIDDVSKNSDYLSCSLETKSEIVIPIRLQGKPIGELDIDCKIKNGFSKDLEKQLETEVKLFETSLAKIF